MTALYDVLNTKFTALVGSSPENDIVFNDPDISPRHCQISKIEDGKYLIVDLNSVTGTFVNNKRIDKEFISDTDFISVGNNIFQIRKKITEHAVQKTVTVETSEPVIETKMEQTVSDSPASAIDTGPTVVRVTGGTRESRKKIGVYLLSAPEDRESCLAINKHLSAIRFNTVLPIEITGDFNVPPGEDITRFKQKVFEADIVLAFISVDFLNNDECYERIKKVIINHNNRKTILLPILARNCMWKATPFANLPLLPKNQQPLNNKQFWNSEDDALTEVVNDIYNSINEFTKHATEDRPVQPAAHASVLPVLQVDWRQNYLWKAFWKRVAASLLDGLIIGLPLTLVFYVAILGPVQRDVYYYGNVSESTSAQIVFYYILLMCIQIVIYAFMESSQWRGTPGKRIMGLQISDNAGNPISFKKSAVRNIIKLLIFAFASVASWITLLYLIAQTVSYFITKKFFHDQLSNTVIGERLK